MEEAGRASHADLIWGHSPKTEILTSFQPSEGDGKREINRNETDRKNKIYLFPATATEFQVLNFNVNARILKGGFEQDRHRRRPFLAFQRRLDADNARFEH